MEQNTPTISNYHFIQQYTVILPHSVSSFQPTKGKITGLFVFALYLVGWLQAFDFAIAYDALT